MKKIVMLITAVVMLMTLVSCTKSGDKKKGSKNKYTIYGEVEVSMDINVDDYIKEEEGQKIFCFSKLAGDLGWTKAETEDQTMSFKYSLIKDDMAAVLLCTGSVNKSSQIAYVNRMCLGYVKNEEPYDPYYDDGADNRKHRDCFAEIGMQEDQEYRLDDTYYCISKSDMILMTYLLWSAKNDMGSEPLAELIPEDSKFFYQQDDTTNNYRLY